MKTSIDQLIEELQSTLKDCLPEFKAGIQHAILRAQCYQNEPNKTEELQAEIKQLRTTAEISAAMYVDMLNMKSSVHQLVYDLQYDIKILKEKLTVERNVRISFERAHGKVKSENEVLKKEAEEQEIVEKQLRLDYINIYESFLPLNTEVKGLKESNNKLFDQLSQLASNLADKDKIKRLYKLIDEYRINNQLQYEKTEQLKADNERSRDLLSDYKERMNRCRKILQDKDGGNWGILDTSISDEVLSKLDKTQRFKMVSFSDKVESTDPSMICYQFTGSRKTCTSQCKSCAEEDENNPTF